MADRINNGENLKEIPISLEDIRDKFIVYDDILPFWNIIKIKLHRSKKMISPLLFISFTLLHLMMNIRF